MKKKDIFIIPAIVFIALGYWFFHSSTPVPSVPVNPLNTIYTIEGKSVTLINGHAETEIVPNSSVKLVTDVWGMPATGELNNDGNMDAAVLLTQSEGGSGTFYYVAVALGNGARTNAILLGDRIAPQNLQIVPPDLILVNYANRKPNDAMTTQPSEGVSSYFRVRNATLEKYQPTQ